MILHRMEQRSADGYAAWGTVWPEGAVQADAVFTAENEDGSAVPVQSRVTAYWPDKTVKWASHVADSSRMSERVAMTALKGGKEAGHGEAQGAGISVEKRDHGVYIQAGCMGVFVPSEGNCVLQDFTADGRLAAKKAELVLILEQPEEEDGITVKREIPYVGQVQQIEIEEEGPISCVVKLMGIHKNVRTGEEKFPFILRETVCYDRPEIGFTHTFLYDGDEQKDFLKGIGVRFYSPMDGAVYNRHVKFGVDHGVFHEALTMLLSWRPRIPEEIYRLQMDGKKLELTKEEHGSTIEAAKQMPVWGEYKLCQDSPSHFAVRKRVDHGGLCYLEPLHGYRAPGTAAFAGESGGMMFAGRDFWQKYPSGYQFTHLDQDMAEATVWLWSPDAEAMDFRHYADEGYPQTYYEGFPEVGATPYGIANTNQFTVRAVKGSIPEDKELQDFGHMVQKPPIYLASPEYYHQVKAFGIWSLPKKDSPMENWIEEQLDKAVEFYRKEIDVRNWYGMFNYGDVMHTYDKARHCWRYDMGGYAWQNTELVPTLWLWYAFMRTGREDIFTLAEAMSRHCSEVDTYHFGKYKGIGSRHNVRHWGCSCKEARIAMAGHHRFYYYLAGDLRMGDVFDDVKDGDFALLNIDPLRYFFDKTGMISPTHARSGPDWSSMCSNWMTQWERFGDDLYMNKIKTGIGDLKKAPLQLISGPDFEYDPADSHLRYIGERTNGGTHLQVCMGAIETWLELAGLLGDGEWTKMLADYGRFYYLSKEEQQRQSEGLVGNREFSLPFMAAGIAAFGAFYYQDRELAEKTWKILLEAMPGNGKADGFTPKGLKDTANQEELQEISWISTNFTAQWCLNVIVALELIRDDLPEEL